MGALTINVKITITQNIQCGYNNFSQRITSTT